MLLIAFPIIFFLKYLKLRNNAIAKAIKIPRLRRVKVVPNELHVAWSTNFAVKSLSIPEGLGSTYPGGVYGGLQANAELVLIKVNKVKIIIIFASDMIFFIDVIIH